LRHNFWELLHVFGWFWLFLVLLFLFRFRLNWWLGFWNLADFRWVLDELDTLVGVT
jgi:hypothetical protein